MFSLIVTLIAIALVAALALASLYYGSEGLARGASQARAVELIGTGAQIAAALQLQDADAVARDGAPQNAFSGLPTQPYLVSAPAGWTAQCGPVLCQASVALDLKGAGACAEVNRKAGFGEAAQASVEQQARSVFFCAEELDAQGAVTGHVFNYLYRRAAS